MSLQGRDCVERAALGRDLSVEEIATDELARLARAGNAEAFTILATRFRPRLLVVLTKRLAGQVADAEDITQVALTKAWKCIRTYDESRSFSAWLYTIALRSATDHQRRQIRRQRHETKFADREATTKPFQSPSSNDDVRGNIWSTAKRVLTHPQYVALWLRYAEDFSPAEIAKTMGKTTVATRVLLHRARAKLQPHLTTEAPNP